MKLIKSPSLSDDKKQLAKNIFYLVLLQGSNYILPLLTVPYLVRILGPEYYGLLSFATATIAYFGLISDYGFNLSATRQISIHRENKDKVNEIFSSVMIIKVLLTLVCLVILTLLDLLIDKFNHHWQVYLITFGVVIGQVIFPTWLFQGLELMKYVTYTNLLSRLLFTILIFVFVKDRSEYILVPLFTSIGSIVGGLVAFYFATNKLRYKFSMQKYEILKFQLKEGWHLFYSSLSISCYTISTTFILGLFTNNSTVGQFAAIDKIIQATKGIYQPISQAVYPYVGKRFQEDRIKGIGFISKLLKLVSIIMFLLSVLIYIFSEKIINLVLGKQFLDSVILLKIMSPLPLIISLSNIFGIQVMLNLGLNKAFSNIVSLAAILGISLNFLLAPLFNSNGTAFSLLIVELLVTVSMAIVVKQHFFNE